MENNSNKLKTIHLRLDKVYGLVEARTLVSLYQRLSEDIDKTGSSKSKVIASTLAAYLGSVQDISLKADFSA